MRNYKEEHFSVFEKKTGKKIADCGNREDARMLVHMDWQNREYKVNKMLMGQVIDIEIPKALPTNEVTIDTKGYQEHQNQWMVDKINQLPQIKLPEGQGEPVRV